MGRSGDVPDSRPKLALISYMFPPAGGVAVLRALSFVKYLPSHGIDVHVLAARNPSTPAWDYSLLEQIPPLERPARLVRSAHFSATRGVYGTIRAINATAGAALRGGIDWLGRMR